MTRYDLRPGDWVQFYKNGQLVVGVVHYLHDDCWPRAQYVSTDIGKTCCHNILEMRRNTTEHKIND